MAEPPTHPCLPLTDLLDNISHMYPQLFFKPLFACAASAKELTVQNYLSILTINARFLPDFWTRDPEMISVALMSEGSNKPQGTVPTWGKARLGQCALLVELIACAQALHKAEAMTSVCSFCILPKDGHLISFFQHPGPAHLAAAKFFTVLEARVGILLSAKVGQMFLPQLDLHWPHVYH